MYVTVSEQLVRTCRVSEQEIEDDKNKRERPRVRMREASQVGFCFFVTVAKDF